MNLRWKQPEDVPGGLDKPPSLRQEDEAKQGTVWKALDVYGGEGHVVWTLPSGQAQLLLCRLQPSSTGTSAELQVFSPQTIGGKGLWGVGKG